MPANVSIPTSYSDSIAVSNKDSLLKPSDFFSDTCLVAIINIALTNNFDLQRAIQRIEYAKANYLVNKAAFLPSLNGSGRAGVDKFSTNTMNGVGNMETNLSPNISNGNKIPNPTPDYFVGLITSWELGLWGK